MTTKLYQYKTRIHLVPAVEVNHRIIDGIHIGKLKVAID